MAEKSKLKHLISDDESSSDDGYDSGNDDDDLGLSLDKLNLGPKKKLLVLCLGLLVHRVHLKNQSTVRGLRPDVVYGNFMVFKRPFCTDFLKFCFERFEVALWSSAMEHNIEDVLSNIAGEMRSKFLFVWTQMECMRSGFYCLDNKKKPLFLKKMKDLWETNSLNGQYSASNTLLIDDDPHTSLLNPPNTAIFPQPYKLHDSADTLLGPDGELRKYLEGLVDAEDVPSYVKDHKIGQLAITPEHPDWNFYSKIVNLYSKILHLYCNKDETAVGSSK